MKKFMFIALFLTAFMFPFFGSISNADALGNYGCANPDKKTHVNCLRGLLSSTPHGLAVQQSSPSNDGLGNYGCGNPNKRTHVNCLRGLLDQHGAHLQVGNPGGGAPGMNPPGGEHHDPNMPPPGGEHHDPNMPPPGGEHHDPNMPPPGVTGMAPGAHSPVDISHCANLEPTAARPACEAAAHGGPGPMTGGNHPQGDPCMVVPAGPDRVACYAAPRP